MTADRIREIRERRQLSRRQLAAELGVVKRTVEYWEQGRGEPNPSAEKILESLASYTKTS